MTNNRKKLIEVALPLEAINAASAREKSIRHGHPSTLHLWWARRPLAACRAVLFASLVDDPDSDPSFWHADGSVDEDRAGVKWAELFNLIEEVVQWENSNNPEIIRSARAEIARCVASNLMEAGKLKDDQAVADGWTVGQLIRKCHCRPQFMGLDKKKGTWPIRTERGARTVGIGTNALASSIVLVCRPRPDAASLATRKEFLTALRKELPEALHNLQRGSIAPVDLAQAAIGPGMAVFNRYSKVMESDGSPMTVRTALGIINQTLDEVLAEQEGEFDSDTRWALSWFDQLGMEEGPFGVAETLSKAKNTAVGGLVEAGVVKARAGKVQLVGRDGLPDDWDPAKDRRLTVWEVTQHLIRTLDKKGESEAASLFVIFDDPVRIPDGTEVYVEVVATESRKTLAEQFGDLIGTVPDLPPDMAAQHDHYLHGAPKR